MAKKGTKHNIIMRSTESSHQKTVHKSNVRGGVKLLLKMYDPKLKKHVLFKEKGTA